MNNQRLVFKTYKGKEIAAIMEPLAQLRMGVFKEYPYLYDGEPAEEKAYLSQYLNMQDSFVLMIFDQDRVVGATTAAPLIDLSAEFRAVYEKEGLQPAEGFYFGESMIVPDYRGKGLYKTFINERQEAAKQYGAKFCTFIAVKRPDDHPLKPSHYQDLKPVWDHYAFIEHPRMEVYYTWKDIDQPEKTQKSLAVWVKFL